MEVEDQDRVVSAGKTRTRTLPFAISVWGLAEGEEGRGWRLLNFRLQAARVLGNLSVGPSPTSAPSRPRAHQVHPGGMGSLPPSWRQQLVPTTPTPQHGCILKSHLLWHPTPVFLPGEAHGQRSPAG